MEIRPNTALPRALSAGAPASTTPAKQLAAKAAARAAFAAAKQVAAAAPQTTAAAPSLPSASGSGSAPGKIFPRGSFINIVA